MAAFVDADSSAVAFLGLGTERSREHRAIVLLAGGTPLCVAWAWLEAVRPYWLKGAVGQLGAQQTQVSHPANRPQLRREESLLLFLCRRSIRPHLLSQRSPGSAHLNEEAAAIAPSAPRGSVSAPALSCPALALGSATTRHFPPAFEPQRNTTTLGLARVVGLCETLSAACTTPRS